MENHKTSKSLNIKSLTILANLTVLSLFYLYFGHLRHAKTTENNYFNPNDPVDVVYTWVNGSDPEFLMELNQVKKELSTNRENLCSDPDLCFISNFLIVHPEIEKILENELEGVESIISIYENDVSLSLIEFNTIDDADYYFDNGFENIEYTGRVNSDYVCTVKIVPENVLPKYVVETFLGIHP